MGFLKNVFVSLQLAFFILTLVGCKKGNREKFPDSDMYNFSDPKIITLPEVLDEISGIAYYPKDTSVFAIIDEDGLLYKIPLKNPMAVRYWPFDKKRDYEDLVLKDSIFYALVSNGDILSIRFEGDSIYTNKSKFSREDKAGTEFESLIVVGDSLVIICKECVVDDKKTINSYSYSFKDTSNTYHPFMVIDVSRVDEKVKIDGKFKASAAAVNPVNNDIYIISSIQKLLLITDSKGQVKNVIKLDPKIYKQPEGMTFTPEGNLIISNEFAEVGFANLLLLKNKKIR